MVVPHLLRTWMVLPLCLLGLACSNLQRPTLAVQSMSIKEITPQGFTISFAIAAHNPNTVVLPLATMDYSLDLGNVHFLDGKAEGDGSIPANGDRVILLPVTIGFENLLTTWESLRKSGGDVPYALAGGIGFGGNMPLLSAPMRVPLSYSGTLHLRELLRDPKLLLQSPAAQKLAQKLLANLFGG